MFRGACFALCVSYLENEQDKRAPPIVPSEGPACQVRRSEGRACRVHSINMDNPYHFNGHDERAPPPSEGRACRVREKPFDNPSRFRRHESHVPANGHDQRAPPICVLHHPQIWRTLFHILTSSFMIAYPMVTFHYTDRGLPIGLMI
jgi:hypothetical protein